jgi:F-box protein 9
MLPGRRRVKNACHLVCYFRYVRFLPDGRLLYRTSPETVARVARRMAEGPGRRRRKDDMVHDGRYRLEVRLPRAGSTVCRTKELSRL